MKSGMVKEGMEPTLGPNMKHFDEFISQHEDGGHKHHSKEYAKHAAGHKVNHDHVKSIGKV